jgi:putative transposase
MARLARIVVPDHPHHVTQRGNRRQKIFFEDGDYALYRDLLAERAAKAGVAVWATCLMPNHVHLILVPATEDGLALALGETHRRYTGFVNARMRVTDHLFQGRFGSVVLDEPHLVAAARYVALNPVRARLVRRAQDWPWSSARAHLKGRDDGLVMVTPLLERTAGRFADLLDEGRHNRSSPHAARPKRSVVHSARRPFSIVSKHASAAPFVRASAGGRNARLSDNKWGNSKVSP